jgi:hypothetical protein
MATENRFLKTATELLDEVTDLWQAAQALAEMGRDHEIEALLLEEMVAPARGWSEHKQEEVAQFAAVRRAGGEEQLLDAVRPVVASWAGGGAVASRPAAPDYPDLPKLVDAAQGALDRMLEVYADLPPYDGDLAELFTAALLAVPVRATVDKLVWEEVHRQRGDE